MGSKFCSSIFDVSGCSVFSLLIAYFVVGIMIMKFKMNAEGKEIIPQSAFWTAIPGLIKVKFSINLFDLP